MRNCIHVLWGRRYGEEGEEEEAERAAEEAILAAVGGGDRAAAYVRAHAHMAFPPIRHMHTAVHHVI